MFFIIIIFTCDFYSLCICNTNSLNGPGDTKVLTAARAEIQKGFRNPDLAVPEEERLSHVEGVSKFLLSNIVQGSKNTEDTKYRTYSLLKKI